MQKVRTNTSEALEQDAILAEMVRRLVASLSPERVYLFGSRARDEANDDSDYDLLVIVRESSVPRYRRELAAFRALIGVGAPKDVVVLTREEFDERRSVVCSLPATVEREGKLLYAA